MATETRKPTAAIAPFGLRMQPDLRERIEAAAEAAGRSMNAEIVDRLEGSFVAPQIRNMDSGHSRPISDDEYKRFVKAIVEINRSDVETLRAEIRALRFELAGANGEHQSKSTT